MRLYISLLTLIVILTAGCHSRVRDTGFLEGGYESFNVVDEKGIKIRLDETFIAKGYDLDDLLKPAPSGMLSHTTQTDNLPKQQPVVFIVAPTEWHCEDPFVGHPERREQIEFTIRERMYRYLLRTYPEPTRVRYAYTTTDPLVRDCRMVTITSHITDQKTGVGPLRYFLGWGVGKTRLQIEGEIFEGPNRELKIGEYAIRRGHGGYAQNGLNVNVLKPEYCMRYAAEEAVAQFTESIGPNIAGVVQFPAEAPRVLATSQQAVPPPISDSRP